MGTSPVLPVRFQCIPRSIASDSMMLMTGDTAVVADMNQVTLWL
jgi:hypothetical protein